MNGDARFFVIILLTLSLSLPLIYYEWVDFLSILVVHATSEVCHSGLIPQHMAEPHSNFLTHHLHTQAHTHT